MTFKRKHLDFIHSRASVILGHLLLTVGRRDLLESSRLFFFLSVKRFFSSYTRRKRGAPYHPPSFKEKQIIVPPSGENLWMPSAYVIPALKGFHSTTAKWKMKRNESALARGKRNCCWGAHTHTLCIEKRGCAEIGSSRLEKILFGCRGLPDGITRCQLQTPVLINGSLRLIQ